MGDSAMGGGRQNLQDLSICIQQIDKKLIFQGIVLQIAV